MKGVIYRAAVASFILAVTLSVSIILQKMVYAIPVLAVLLYLFAVLPNLSTGSTRRNVDQEGVETGLEGS